MLLTGNTEYRDQFYPFLTLVKKGNKTDSLKLENEMAHIQPNGLFAQPTDFKEIENWIERHSPEERIHLWTAAMMTWNYLASQVNKENETHTKSEI